MFSFQISLCNLILYYCLLLLQITYLNQHEDKSGDTKVQDKDNDDEDVTEKRRKYFSEKSSYTPETRIEMQKVGEGDSRQSQCVEYMELFASGHGGN